MLATNDRKIYEKAKLLKDLSHQPGKRFYHDRIGFNYRMSSLQAALGVAQLKEINENIQKKHHISRMYAYLLRDIPFIEAPPKNVCWMFDVLVTPDAPFKRDKLLDYLSKKGIDTRPYFYPLHKQGALRIYYNKKDKFPVTDSLSERGFYLPSGLNITDEQIERVAQAIKKFISKL